MAMLAEPRRKQKWTLNPRGKHWSEDSNKFGQKMLEKMGWSSGMGLGANLDGMTEHIRARYKNDQAGIGFSHNDEDKQWTRTQEGFNELLQKLHDNETAETSTKDGDLSGKSLELKSKQSRARVHYRKFTRGKDVNKYSTKDLANIFGKRNLDDKLETAETMVEIKVKIEEPSEDLVGTSDTSHGVMTIKGGSITDYFKSKMSQVGKKSNIDVKNETDSESETRTGFGFAPAKTKDSDSETLAAFGFASVKTEVESPSAEKQILHNNLGLENPALDVTSPKNEKHSVCRFAPVKAELESPAESRQSTRKAKIDFVFENPALDVTSVKDENETPRKRKSDFAFENPCLELGSSPPEAVATPKRRRGGFAFENGGLDLESVSQTTDLQLSVDSPLPVSAKKKRKKKSKECPRPAEGFTNEALSLEFGRDEEISSASQFEVSRSCLGLANDALDLADETNGKKRVTFSETVEYETDHGTAKKKRNKNAGKLDKFEVDNEKLKKKRKKSRNIEVDNVFVNEAMDVETVSQEASDNASNERKSERARRKRERGRSNLATIEEAPEEEKDLPEVVTLDESLVGKASEDLEILSLDTPKKKKKKKKSKAVTVTEAQEDLNTTIDISEDIEDAPSESPTVEKKLKRAKTEPEVETVEETARSSMKRNKKRKSLLTISDRVEEIKVVDLEETIVEENEKAKKNDSGVESKSMDKENVEVTGAEVVEGSKRSRKQRQKAGGRSRVKNSTENEDAAEKIDEKPANDTPDVQNGSQSPWDGKVKKSKKIFKALFARSPVVHFAGSNINEIKGYGMDV